METENLATLDELRERLGAPADGTLAVMAPDSARERFIARGRQIGSQRVLTDAVRLYSYAYSYWSRASEAERAALVGCSEELLRLGVDRALALREMTLGHEEEVHGESTSLAARTRAARAAYQRGLGLRDQARTALRTVTAVDPKLREALRAAEGTGLEGAEALATALDRIAAFGADLAARGDAAISARLVLAGVTPAYVASLAAVGAEVRETARAADAVRNVKKVSQAALDYLDGLNLELLSHIVAAFDAAHRLDSSVVRLVPIATRHMFSGGRKTKAAAPSEVAEAPAEPAPTE